METREDIPLNFNFIRYEDPDEDEEDRTTEKVEIAESVPLDYKLIHYQNEDGDELIKLEDRASVPLNFDFL